MTDWFTGDIDVNGINIHYHRTGGDRPPVVFCHGVTDYGFSWKWVAREFEQDYDVIMYDQRGHGLSDAPPVGYTFADHAEDLAGLIISLNLDKPHIIGHSGGAIAAAFVVAELPSRVTSLVLVDPAWGTGWGDWGAMKDGIKRWFLNTVSMTREDLLATCRKSNPHWSEEEITL